MHRHCGSSSRALHERRRRLALHLGRGLGSLYLRCCVLLQHPARWTVSTLAPRLLYSKEEPAIVSSPLPCSTIRGSEQGRLGGDGACSPLTCPGVAILLPPLACRMSSLMSLSLHYLAHITRSDDLPSPNFDLSFLPAACVPVLYMQRAAPTGPFEGDGVAGAEVEARSLGIPVFAYPPAPIYPTSPPRLVACRSKDGSSQQTIQDLQPRLQ